MPDAEASKSRSLPYGTLKQTHKTYDGRLIQELEDLYVGGYQIQQRAKQYLCRVVNEHQRRYDERCAVAAYKPYFGQIVDQFVSDLFGQPLSVKPAPDADDPNTPGDVPDEDYYREFEKNVNREGMPFADLMMETIRTSLKQRTAIVAIDAPARGDGPDEPVTRADEVARGLDKLYAYEIPVEQLIDWECTRGGQDFVWAILRTVEQKRKDPRGSRGLVKETFTIWEVPTDAEGIPIKGGKASWSKYAIEYDPKQTGKDQPEDTETVNLESEGTTSFTKIPLLRLELPEGLWVGNKIGTQAKEYWQRRSQLLGAESRSMVTIPYVKKGPEAPAIGGAIPAEVTQNPYRGNDPIERFNDDGWVELGSDDELGFAEPTGGCYELVDKQLASDKEDMFAVNHQMAAAIKPTPGALGRSGLSKQKDQDATARVLRAIGHIVRQFAIKVWSFVSEARGEDVHWTPHGLDGYDSEDRQEVIEEAISLDQVQIPSITFRKQHKRMVAEKLLKGVDSDTMATVIQEIEDGVDAEDEIRQMQDDAKKDALVNLPPPPPVVPAPKVPTAKPPAAPGAPAPPKEIRS